jgi:hypothetical protein
VLTLETHDYNHVVGTFHPEGKLKKNEARFLVKKCLGIRLKINN